MSNDEIESLAKALDVRGADVKEMEIRLAGGDISIEGDSDDEESFAPIQWLTDESQEQLLFLSKMKRILCKAQN